MMGDEAANTVIADVRVTGMGCDELLTEVRRRHPNSIRVALVGGNDAGSFVRLAVVAQRVLPKPLDPAPSWTPSAGPTPCGNSSGARP